MRYLLILAILLPSLAFADNDPRLARIIHQGRPHRIDRCMRRFIEREGRDFRTPDDIHALGGAEARIGDLFTSLRTQIGVVGVDWDRCVMKPAIWPGTWTLGVVFRTREGHAEDILERCYTIQGGVPGTLNIFGWRPHVRMDRQDLKCIRAGACPGFVEQEGRRCEELIR